MLMRPSTPFYSFARIARGDTSIRCAPGADHDASTGAASLKLRPALCLTIPRRQNATTANARRHADVTVTTLVPASSSQPRDGLSSAQPLAQFASFGLSE